MFALFCFVLALLALRFKSNGRLETENAALRHHVMVVLSENSMFLANEGKVKCGGCVTLQIGSHGMNDIIRRQYEDTLHENDLLRAEIERLRSALTIALDLIRHSYRDASGPNVDKMRRYLNGAREALLQKRK